MSTPQWPGQPGPGQPIPPPPGQPYGPPPGAYGPPPGQPYGPWGYPPPGRPPKSRKAAWVIGGIAFALVIVVVAGVLVWQFAGGSSPRRPAASARELLLTKSEFPTLSPPGRFTTTSGDGADGQDSGTVTVSPAECDHVLGDDDPTADTAKAELDNSESATDIESSRDYTVRVTKEADPAYSTKFQSVLDRCGEVSFHGEGMTLKGSIKRLDVTGTRVPVNAAVATLRPDTTVINVTFAMQGFFAVVRGTSVEVLCNWMTTDDATSSTPDKGGVGLFNKQVEKIQNAA